MSSQFICMHPLKMNEKSSQGALKYLSGVFSMKDVFSLVVSVAYHNLFFHGFCTCEFYKSCCYNFLMQKVII